MIAEFIQKRKTEVIFMFQNKFVVINGFMILINIKDIYTFKKFATMTSFSHFTVDEIGMPKRHDKTRTRYI